MTWLLQNGKGCLPVIFNFILLITFINLHHSLEAGTRAAYNAQRFTNHY